jgi:hypothetical protein
MDDHDLGALLDATVPASPASDAALARIRRRASQRRRRSPALGGLVTVAVIAIAALGVSWIGGSSNHVTPGGGTTPECLVGDVSQRIDAQSASYDGTTQWAVYADNRSDTPCRVSAPIKATIHDSAGRIFTAVRGTLTALVLPTQPGYVNVLAANAPTLIAELKWVLPCSNGPVELEVAGFSRTPARLDLPRQPCASSISQSFFQLVRVGDTVAGEPCPFGSITLTIDPKPAKRGNTLRWAVAGTGHTGHLCRTHGLEADIETPDGKVLTAIPGNPAVQNDVFEDLFVPSRPEFVDYLRWSDPCSAGPVVLVVRYHEGMSTGGRLSLPRQRCAGVLSGHFDITREKANP